MMKHLIIFSHLPPVFLSSLISALQTDKFIKIYLLTLIQS